MNTNKILLCLLCLLGVTLRAAQEEPFHVAMYSDEDIRVYPGNKNFRTLSSGEQAEVIRRLHLQMGDPDPSMRFGSSLSLLLLRDDVGIAYMVGLYQQPWDPESHSDKPGSQLSAERILESAAHAGVEGILPFLMDNVYHGSPMSRVISGPMDVVIMPSIQEQSIEMALKSIIKSSAYPQAARDWATRTQNTFDRYAPVEQRKQALAQLKLWWEHNKAAILAKDYAKATWLPPAVGGETTPAPSAPVQPSPPAPTPVPTPPASSSALKWRLLAAAALAALALDWRLRRRR